MTKRNQRIDHLLSPSQRKRLRKLWVDFHSTLTELSATEDPIAKSILQKRVNQLRGQMPPGEASWPLWKEVLQ